MQTINRNAETEYGRANSFDEITSAREYCRRVPLTTYEDYAESIERIRSGAARVLTREPVLLLEPTSGSTAASKLIPYTATLKAEFGRAVCAWISDLFAHDPRLMLGPAYWSVTPVSSQFPSEPSKVPIGFEDDTAYLGRGRQALLRAVMAVPPEVRHIEDVETFRYLTLLYLLRARNLSLVSVWSPTFLTLLLSRLEDWQERLAQDLARGAISPPAPLLPEARRTLESPLRADPDRAEEVRRAFDTNTDPGGACASLWPRLRMVSCWTEAHAALHIPELSAMLPQAGVAGKGLISTECFVSLPLTDRAGKALAVRSHFFEFIPEDGAGEETLLAHELEEHGCYAVVATTGGGLYRYCTGDVVEVAGWMDACPLLRFVGKDLVSDRFGEKLNERHVRSLLERLLPRYAPDAVFAMLAYESDAASYVLFIETRYATAGALAGLGAELERLLRDNYHYDYCRRLGQLGSARVFLVRDGGPATYEESWRLQGQRVGDVKPAALSLEEGWSRRFDGRFVEAD